KIIVKKKENKNKIPTHTTTLQLLKENNAVEIVAEKRGLTVGTIIGHIEKLKGLNQIDDALLANLKTTISKSDFDIIFAAVKKSEDGSLTALFTQLKGKYSYVQIRMVRLFVCHD